MPYNRGCGSGSRQNCALLPGLLIWSSLGSCLQRSNPSLNSSFIKMDPIHFILKGLDPDNLNSNQQFWNRAADPYLNLVMTKNSMTMPFFAISVNSFGSELFLNPSIVSDRRIRAGLPMYSKNVTDPNQYLEGNIRKLETSQHWIQQITWRMTLATMKQKNERLMEKVKRKEK